MSCVFCRILAGDAPAWRVAEENGVVVLLDHRPLLPGHCLVIPEEHVETLHDLAPERIEPVFAATRRTGRAVEAALDADGAFVAVNVKVSQSVPHLHVHVVPRWKTDGLFSPKMIWKRRPYRDDEDAVDTARRIAAAWDDVG